MSHQFLTQCIGAANAAIADGQYAVAVGWCQKAIRLLPKLPEAWYNLGIAYRGLGQREQSLSALQKSASLTTGSADAQNSIGFQLLELGALREAGQCFRRAISLVPGFAFAHSNLGVLYEKQQRFDDAEASFEKAIKLQPELAPLYVNLCGVLNIRRKFTAAEAAARKATELDAGSSEAWSNLAGALCGQRRYAQAEMAARKAIELAPHSPKAWGNLGAALCGLNDFAAAEAAASTALELDATYSEAWIDLSIAQSGQKNYAAAEAAARKATELVPESSAAWRGLGLVLADQGKYKSAVECFSKVVELDPDEEFSRGRLLHYRMNICDWPLLDQEFGEIERQVASNKRVIDPFAVLALTTDLSIHRKVAELAAIDQYPERFELAPISRPVRGERIRLGYYSADFHNHATSYLMAELFELHDKSKFELIGFSYGPDFQDEMRQRVSAAFDRFVDVRALSDIEVAKISRDMCIDIAVDLKGLTRDARLGIFACRAAPVQVSYLGFPGTLGVDFMDYIVADHVLIPPESQRHYSEKIAYLPDSYQVNDAQRHISSRSFTREELGLPSVGFVFACFNNNYKITPKTFAAWMRILERVEGSVLWLLEANPSAALNLRREAEQHGVDPERLVFAKHLPLPEHLARLRVADLFLDTLPYNAHTTTSDALWAGLPVLTCMGESFASRVAASLLSAIALPELITTSQADYENAAVDLAGDPARLAVIKQKLAQNRNTTPLFDSQRFARHLEAAYSVMHERCHADLPPEHIDVQSGATC